MATIESKTVNNDKKYNVATWLNLASGDDGEAVDFSEFPDKSIQIIGVIDTAAPGLEGSMDGTNWIPLTSDGSTAIAAVGLFWIWETPRFIRPNNTGGGASTDLTYILGASTLV